MDFDYFIVFAEMRTGSNFLETNLNAMEGVACHGEAFNPHFIGYPNRSDCLGVTLAERDADPSRLIAAVKGAPGLNGFRFFNDHDPRILDSALDDPRCAKVILTRNPLESYVSWKIAKATNQWKLTDVKRRKSARAQFDADEFSDHVARLQGFQVRLLNHLQKSGQTAFYVAYEDLQDLEVMNGLGKWLGAAAPLESLDKSLKVQNPAPITEKVANAEAMETALAGLDRFNLTRTPNFEPRRGAAVPSYVAGARLPLLYMPILGGPVAEVTKWLAAADGLGPEELPTKLNQKQLRQWKRGMGQHRSFTVLRHPAARAHHVFCSKILTTGPGSYTKIRDTLRRQFKLPLPKDEPGEGYTLSQHREAFEAFLAFLKANLAGQTAIRVDGSWCSQSVALTSFSDFAPPDAVFREEELQSALPELAGRVGRGDLAGPGLAKDTGPFQLSQIHDSALEELIADVYQRDYMMFGFAPWSGA